MQKTIEELCAAGRERFLVGDYDAAASFVRVAMAQVGEQPPPELLRLHGVLAAESQSFDNAIILLDQALDGFRIADDKCGEIATASNLAALLQRTGNLARARALVDWSLTAIAIDDADQRCRLLNIAANIALLQGRWEDAISAVNRARPLAQGRVVCWIELTSASISWNCQQDTQVLAMLERAATLVAGEDGVSIALLHQARTWHCIQTRDLTAAAYHSKQVLSYASLTNHIWLHDAMLAILGVLARASGDAMQAHRLLTQAYKCTQQSGNHALAVGIGWNFALLAQQAHDEGQLIAHISHVLRVMRECGYVTTPLWQPQQYAPLCQWAIAHSVEPSYAQWLLFQIDQATSFRTGLVGHSVTNRLIGDAKLTEREYQVIQYAATGMPDKEIAETLCLSVRTIQNYLHRAYIKLGVRNRSEASIRLASLAMSIEDANT